MKENKKLCWRAWRRWIYIYIFLQDLSFFFPSLVLQVYLWTSLLSPTETNEVHLSCLIRNRPSTRRLEIHEVFTSQSKLKQESEIFGPVAWDLNPGSWYCSFQLFSFSSFLLLRVQWPWTSTALLPWIHLYMLSTFDYFGSCGRIIMTRRQE
jgi:hypothetical protein